MQHQSFLTVIKSSQEQYTMTQPANQYIVDQVTQSTATKDGGLV